MFKSKARGFPVNRYRFCLLARAARGAGELLRGVQGNPRVQSTFLPGQLPWLVPGSALLPWAPASATGLRLSRSQRRSRHGARPPARELLRALPAESPDAPRNRGQSAVWP